jgi:hypothetical protein
VILGRRGEDGGVATFVLSVVRESVKGASTRQSLRWL